MTHVEKAVCGFLRKAGFIIFTSVVFTASGRAADPSAECKGGTTVVKPEDSLSSIARRCGVPENSILAANPTIDGSGDLQVGATVHVQPHEGLGEHAGQNLDVLVTRATAALGRFAHEVNSSVQDLLDKNPDLRTRLEKIKNELGLSRNAPPAVLSVTPQSGPAGAKVSVEAVNLPKDTPVTLGVGVAGSPYTKLQDARTSSTGTLALQAEVPATANPGSDLVFVIRKKDGPIEARSAAFRVVQ
ncbi:MAG: LysM domain-containing protein [Rhodoplanes sp.]